MLLGACDGDGGDGGDTDGVSGTQGSGSSTSEGSTDPSDPSDPTTATDPTMATDPTAPTEGTTTDPTGGSSGATEGEDSSSGSTTDPTETTEAEEGGGSIDVTLTGCEIDFGGTVVVTYNGSLGVASVYDAGATLSGSFQFDLDGTTGDMALSTQHRIDTGNVINMVETAQGTWTNIDGAAAGGGADRIGGTLSVDVWNPSEGQAELSFNGVTLVNVVSDTVCTIDGTITTDSLYP